MTSITTVTRPTTCSGWIAALAECLTTETRSDGSVYITLSQSPEWSEIREDLQSIVHSAHFSELPNDWRYDTVCQIADCLKNFTDSEDWSVENFMEESHGVADTLTDTYTYDLLQWVSGNINRCQWDDSDIANQAEPGDIVELIKLRQYEEIESMVRAVLSVIEQLIDG